MTAGRWYWRTGARLTRSAPQTQRGDMPRCSGMKGNDLYATTWTCPDCGRTHETILSLGELETLQVLGAVISAIVLSGVN